VRKCVLPTKKPAALKVPASFAAARRIDKHCDG
jgi:hypothetical protein